MNDRPDHRRQPSPSGPEAPPARGGSTPRDQERTSPERPPLPLPIISFADPSVDVPEMIAVSTRIGLMAAAVRSDGVIPDGHHARTIRHADSLLVDPPTRVHVSHVEDAGPSLLLVYDLVGAAPRCAPIRMIVQLPPTTPPIDAVRADADVHAHRIERIVQGIGDAILRASRHRTQMPDTCLGHAVAERIQWDFPDRLNPFAGSVRTKTFVDGGAEVEYDLRFRGHSTATPILAPHALDAMTARAAPLASISESRVDGIRCYAVDAVLESYPIPEPSDDPVERLRRLSGIAGRGDDAYTDAFLTLRKALCR